MEVFNAILDAFSGRSAAHHQTANASDGGAHSRGLDAEWRRAAKCPVSSGGFFASP